MLERLARTGRPILVDKGGSPEEAERVERTAKGLANVQTCEVPFAAFANTVARSWLYVGYDSAGQHAAAAAGVRLISIFNGYPNARFLERWRPTGAGPVDVIDAKGRSPAEVLADFDTLLARF